MSVSLIGLSEQLFKSKLRNCS